MGSYEKCRTFNFFHCFWLEIERNLVMADLVSLFDGVCTFFLWKYLILLHFLNLKTPTEDSRLRHGRDFETLFLYRAAVTGLSFTIHRRFYIKYTFDEFFEILSRFRFLAFRILSFSGFWVFLDFESFEILSFSRFWVIRNFWRSEF